MAFPQQSSFPQQSLVCHHKNGKHHEQEKKRLQYEEVDRRNRSIYQGPQTQNQTSYQDDYYSQQQRQLQQGQPMNYGYGYNGQIPPPVQMQYQQQHLQRYNQPMNNGYLQANNQPQPQLQPQVASQANVYAAFQKMSPQDMKKEAPIQYKTVKFKARRVFTPKKLMLEDGTQANNGQLVFSVDNELLEVVGGDCNKHFNMKEGIDSIGKNDLIKQVDIRVTGTYEKELLLNFPTIDALPDEITRDCTPYINHTIDAGSLGPGKVYTANIVKRTITNGILAFATAFNDATPDTMENSITFRKQQGHCILPLMHAVVYHYNKDHENDGFEITEKDVIPGLDAKIQEIRMPYDTVMYYLGVAKANIAEKVSLGNVTTDMCLTVAASAPPDRKPRKKDLASGVDGKTPSKPFVPFQGFCDIQHHLGKNADASAKEKFLKTPQELDVTIEIQFVKLDGRPLQLLI